MLIRLLRRFLRPYGALVALVVALLVVQTVGGLYLPNLNADIINGGVVQGNLHYIWTRGGIMLAITLALGAAAVVAVYCASRVAMGVGSDLREALFAKVLSFSGRDVDRFGTASLITRNTNDVQQIQLFAQMALSVMVVAPIMCVGGIVLAIHEGAALSPLLGVAVPVLAAFIGVVLKAVVPRFRTIQGKLDRLNQVLRDQITGVRVIRAFVREAAENARFASANEDLTATTLAVNRIFALTMPTVMVILNLSSVAVVWFGGRLVSEHALAIGNLTAFLTYILQILMSVMMAVMVAVLLPRAMASGERVAEVLDAEPSITESVSELRPSKDQPLAELDRVSFGYPGSELPVLRQISLTLRPGQTTAVIGGTGAGKTTLINLIPRYFDPSDGVVRVGGVDVRDLSLETLWGMLGVVPQSAYLFSGTVASNLRFADPDASDAALWEALELAQAAQFVAAMPDGLASAIDQGGTNVSGGQRQRLAIARALVKRPPIYLFDDCFSALDPATDARLRETLRDATAEAAVLVVAQRVSTIMHADEILVLEDGAVVGRGRHDDLLATSSAYREIVQSQLGERALA